eukprot:gene10024-20871_t
MGDWLLLEVLGYVPDIFGFASYFRGRTLHEDVLKLEKGLHSEDIKLAERHCKEDIAMARTHHMESINIARQTHFREMQNAMEEHFHEMHADLIHSTREGERSMYDQRNAEFQTLILSATVMFSGLSTVIIQGYLPSPDITFDTIYVLMAIACGLSFAFLFICIVLFTKIVIRSSKFMYRRSNKQTSRVHSVINQSVDLMRRLR